MGRSTMREENSSPLPGTLPFQPSHSYWKLPPPKPELQLELDHNLNTPAIVLKWNLHLTGRHAEISSYELYARQESTADPPSSTIWKKFGTVKALPLPMACTLVQFTEGNWYHFTVRAVDVHLRFGVFSSSYKILVTPKPQNIQVAHMPK